MSSLGLLVGRCVPARRRTPAVLTAAVVAAALSWSMAAPSATADDLTDRRREVKAQLAETKGELSESSHALAAAGIAVNNAQNRLGIAQAELERTQQLLAEAKAKDVAMAAKLKKAKAKLAAAKKAVIAGQARLDAKLAVAGEVIRDQYQQQTNLLPMAVMLQSSSMSDLQTRLQWSTTMFDTTQAAIDELTAIQRQLAAEKARQARLEAEVAADRKAAAANLVVKRGLEEKASRQAASVAQLLRQRQVAESAAADDVAKDKAQYARLAQERASVERRIAVRVAKAKAAREAAARKAAARAAKAAAAARQAAKANKQSSRRSAPSAPSRSSSNSSRRVSSSSSAHHGFSYPVSAPITSPYGRRFHPVLHYWKLHDGTDFGAGCGTPIRAAASGRVAERYYNSGYGNRLMIDHGEVDGREVTTGYNHAISYTVGVGQRVREGQVIGYVGTTGYSTGCHLHLMVWLDGRMVNPMSWY